MVSDLPVPFSCSRADRLLLGFTRPQAQSSVCPFKLAVLEHTLSPYSAPRLSHDQRFTEISHWSIPLKAHFAFLASRVSLRLGFLPVQPGEMLRPTEFPLFPHRAWRATPEFLEKRLPANTKDPWAARDAWRYHKFFSTRNRILNMLPGFGLGTALFLGYVYYDRNISH